MFLSKSITRMQDSLSHYDYFLPGLAPNPPRPVAVVPPRLNPPDCGAAAVAVVTAGVLAALGVPKEKPPVVAAEKNIHND